jgi:hypothetical protein
MTVIGPASHLDPSGVLGDDGPDDVVRAILERPFQETLFFLLQRLFVK